MNLLHSILYRFRPDTELHTRLRLEAAETLDAVEAVREKRKEVAKQFPERDFPMAGFLERKREHQ